MKLKTCKQNEEKWMTWSRCPRKECEGVWCAILSWEKYYSNFDSFSIRCRYGTALRIVTAGDILKWFELK